MSVHGVGPAFGDSVTLAMGPDDNVTNTEPNPPKPIEEMTDREIAEETLALLRFGMQSIQAMGNSGIMSGILGSLTRRR